MACVNEYESPQAPTYELPDGWFIDEDGFYAVRLPTVYPTQEHNEEAQSVAFSWSGLFHRGWHHYFYVKCWFWGCLDWYQKALFDMSVDRVSQYLHHLMREYVPGYDEACRYQNGAHKKFRLIFDNQCEILCYRMVGATGPSSDEGATLIVVETDGTRRCLLYDSRKHNGICYPDHRDIEDTSFEIPIRETASAIVDVYAMIAAIPHVNLSTSDVDRRSVRLTHGEGCEMIG